MWIKISYGGLVKISFQLGRTCKKEKILLDALCPVCGLEVEIDRASYFVGMPIGHGCVDYGLQKIPEMLVCRSRFYGITVVFF
jgi:hypothetical protein